MFRHRLATSGTAGFTTLGVDFDGVSDYMTRGSGLTGASDSPDGWLSLWIRLDGGDGSVLTILDSPDSGGNTLFLARNASNKFWLAGINNSATATFGMTSNSAKTAGASWIHVAMSWQWRPTLVQQIYIDGTSDFGGNDNNAATGTIDYTGSDFYVGEKTGSTPTSGVKLDACLAELIYAPGQTLDLSKAANMAKLRSSSGKPVNPGADASAVTGVAPLVYLSVRAGGAATDFATNKGTGGSFAITGSLDLASSNPSD
jgi:hypothetical protein